MMLTKPVLSLGDSRVLESPRNGDHRPQTILHHWSGATYLTREHRPGEDHGVESRRVVLHGI